MLRNLSRTRAERGAPAARVRRPRRSPLGRLLVPAVLALAIVLPGCLGAGTDDANADVMGHAGGTDDGTTDGRGGDGNATDDDTQTYEPIETVRVNFPFGPTDPAPTDPALAVPDKTAALKFEISWHSTTGNMIWSSYTPPPPATEPLRIRLEWSDGGHATTIVMNTSLHVSGLSPGGAFETQKETLSLEPARGGRLEFSPTGWGDVWAIVEVSAAHAMDEPGPFEPETHTWDGVIPVHACIGPDGGGTCVNSPTSEDDDSNTFQVSEGASLASFEFTWGGDWEWTIHVGGDPTVVEGHHTGTSPLRFEVPLDDSGTLAVSVFEDMRPTGHVHGQESEFHMELTVS